jgi:hypothetical protein
VIDWLRRPRTRPDVTLSAVEDVADEEPADPSHEQVYGEAARHYLDVQISPFDVLDSRAAQIFSVGSVALPLTFALLNLGSNNVDIPVVAVWSLRAGLGVYLVLLYCVTRAGLIRELKYRPALTTLRDYSEELPGLALLRWVANEYQESSDENEIALRKKSRWVGMANITPYAEGVLLGLAAILAV